MKKISLFDHRLRDVEGEQNCFSYGIFISYINCSCGKSFDNYDEFNTHQKEELNKQLREQNIELEIV